MLFRSGRRAGQEGAMRDYGADDAFPITDIDDILPGLIEGRDRVYSAMGSNPEFDRHLMEWINTIRSKASLGAQPPNEFVALDHPGMLPESCAASFWGARQHAICWLHRLHHRIRLRVRCPFHGQQDQHYTQ